MFKVWASLEMIFISETCTLEAETSVSGFTKCKVVIGADKKQMFFGVTRSFKTATIHKRYADLL